MVHSARIVELWAMQELRGKVNIGCWGRGMVEVLGERTRGGELLGLMTMPLWANGRTTTGSRPGGRYRRSIGFGFEEGYWILVC